MTFKNLKIVGSSHIAQQSMDEVKRAFSSFEPDIVAVELDIKRLHALQSGESKLRMRDIFRVGVKGFLFMVLGRYVQKKLGKFVGVDAGSEMKTAINLAREKGIKVALIDRDIEITLKRFSKVMGWREKWHFFQDLFLGVFSRKKEMKKYGIENLDLSKVPSKKLIEKLISVFRARYPSIYRVLIAERDEVMAANIAQIRANNPDRKLLVVVGAGHEEGIKRLLKEREEGTTYSFTINSTKS